MWNFQLAPGHIRMHFGLTISSTVCDGLAKVHFTVVWSQHMNAILKILSFFRLDGPLGPSNAPPILC